MVYKNNLTKEESDVIRDIVRNFPNIHLHRSYGHITFIEDGGSGRPINGEERKLIYDSLTALIKSLDDLRYLPEIATNGVSYVIKEISINCFSHWPDYKEDDEEMKNRSQNPDDLAIFNLDVVVE